jgi:dolichyl-phosphate beta-glucosyltransferase
MVERSVSTRGSARHGSGPARVAYRPIGLDSLEVPSISQGAEQVVDLDVVVPVWNEERRLKPTLMTLMAHLSTLRLEAMVTVVDNGSVDCTADVVDAVAGASKSSIPIRLLGCSRQGKGAAVRRGMLASRAQWRGFCDADLSTPPHTLTAAVQALRDGCPIVIGSRRCVGADIAVRQPLVRRIGSSAFYRITRPLTGGITDSQCGFKFFTATAAYDVFSRARVDGFTFDVEILGIAARLGIPVREIPVTWTDQAGSSFSTWSDGARVLKEVRAIQASLAGVS